MPDIFKPNHTLPLIAPSILAADFTRLGEEIDKAQKGGAEWIHCDVMDGHFVPNISYGPMIVEAARNCTNAFLDVHLMIEKPDKFIPDFVNAGADLISVHCEATYHLHRSLQLIRSYDLPAGVAINPGTPLELIEPVLDDVALVVLMSVNPGFGGQKFIESTWKRLNRLQRMRDERRAGFLIEIDGGVGANNASALTRMGADVLVAGSSVFKADDISGRVAELTEKAQSGRREMA